MHGHSPGLASRELGGRAPLGRWSGVRLAGPQASLSQLVSAPSWSRISSSFSPECLYFSGAWKIPTYSVSFFSPMPRILPSTRIPAHTVVRYLFMSSDMVLKVQSLSSRVFILPSWSHMTPLSFKKTELIYATPSGTKVLCFAGISQEFFVPKSHLTICPFSQTQKVGLLSR